MLGYGLDSLAQDRDRWQVLVNEVMNLPVPKRWGISSLAANRLASLLCGVSKLLKIFFLCNATTCPLWTS
jgi:hypothetical protein